MTADELIDIFYTDMMRHSNDDSKFEIGHIMKVLRRLSGEPETDADLIRYAMRAVAFMHGCDITNHLASELEENKIPENIDRLLKILSDVEQSFYDDYSSFFIY